MSASEVTYLAAGRGLTPEEAVAYYRKEAIRSLDELRVVRRQKCDLERSFMDLLDHHEELQERHSQMLVTAYAEKTRLTLRDVLKKWINRLLEKSSWL